MERKRGGQHELPFTGAAPQRRSALGRNMVPPMLLSLIGCTAFVHFLGPTSHMHHQSGEPLHGLAPPQLTSSFTNSTAVSPMLAAAGPGAPPPPDVPPTPRPTPAPTASPPPPAQTSARGDESVCAGGENGSDITYWHDAVKTRGGNIIGVSASAAAAAAARGRLGAHAPPAGTKYVTFEPDSGGYNNIRMGAESVALFARATGRTLVLPAEQRMYLIGIKNIAHSPLDFFEVGRRPSCDIGERVGAVAGVSDRRPGGPAPPPSDKAGEGGVALSRRGVARTTAHQLSSQPSLLL